MGKESNLKEKVKSYLMERPLLLLYLKEGLINISALTRKIKKELKIKKSDEAVMMAIHRVGKFFPSIKENEVLKNSAIGIKTNYCVIVGEKKLDIKADAVSSFGKIYLYIAPEKEGEKAKEYISKKEGLMLIEFSHPIEVETTPGVVFKILSLFYEMNISIIELISSWDKTYLLVEEKDGKKVINYLI